MTDIIPDKFPSFLIFVNNSDFVIIEYEILEPL